MTEHEKQMAIARQLQAERTPIRNPRPRHGGRVGSARGSTRGTTTTFGANNALTDRGRLTNQRGQSIPKANVRNNGMTSAVRTRSGGGGLSTSMWASPPHPEYAAVQKSVPAVAPVSSQEPPVPNDPTEVDELNNAVCAPAQPALPPLADPAPATTGPTAGGSISQSRAVEASLLDEDVPFLGAMQAPIKPTRMQTMFPYHPGLSSSRWCPRTTLDGRPIED